MWFMFLVGYSARMTGISKYFEVGVSNWKNTKLWQMSLLSQADCYNHRNPPHAIDPVVSRTPATPSLFYTSWISAWILACPLDEQILNHLYLSKAVAVHYFKIYLAENRCKALPMGQVSIIPLILKEWTFGTLFKPCVAAAILAQLSIHL